MSLLWMQRDFVKFAKTVKKKIELTLLVHPEWLKGSPKVYSDGKEYGGSVTDEPGCTEVWNQERAKHLRLIEVRGKLPETVTCPQTGIVFSTTRALYRRNHISPVAIVESLATYWKA